MLSSGVLPPPPGYKCRMAQIARRRGLRERTSSWAHLSNRMSIKRQVNASTTDLIEVEVEVASFSALLSGKSFGARFLETVLDGELSLVANDRVLSTLLVFRERGMP